MRRTLPKTILLLLATLVFRLPAYAQAHESSLSEGEIELLRDAAYVPNDRVAAYIKIIDTRADRIRKLLTSRRKPGREQDLHELLDDFAGIADELNDNLETLGPKHRDIRKSLPKLLEATERWATTLRSAPEDSTYKVVQKLALDALSDLHEAAAKLNTEEIAYFKEHPDAAKAEAQRADPSSNRPEPVEIPR